MSRPDANTTTMTSHADDGAFVMGGWSVDAHAPILSLSYRCARFGPFVETLTFPADCADGLRRLAAERPAILDLAHAILGVSYYKAAAASRIIIGDYGLSPAALAAVRAVYTEGLGEFYVRNDLAYPPKVRWEVREAPDQAEIAAPAHAPLEDDAPSVLLSFGGGKDSHVAYNLLTDPDQERAPARVDLSSVTLRDDLFDVLQDAAPTKLIPVARRLDPELIAANAKGALNGHIPITAVNSAILALLAAARGDRWLVFANEASADEGTMRIGDVEVNHQFSKSLAYERLFAAAASEALGPDFAYFSILRPFSELWIAAQLSRDHAALQRFRSCNRNFATDPARRPKNGRWCGECSKCAFTALLFAPFLSRAALTQIMEADPLDNPRLEGEYRDMAGLTDKKPWDCVGTVREVRACLAYANAQPDWRGARNVQALIAALTPLVDLDAAARDVDALITERGPHNIPQDALAFTPL